MRQLQMIPRSSLEEMPWWKGLTADEQRTILIATQALGEGMTKLGFSKLAIGRELVKLTEVLEPKRKFCDYLRRHFPTCSLATAYRWIENYQAVQDRLPELFIRVAMSHGFHALDAEMIEILPPPRTKDQQKIVAYLLRLKAAKRTRKIVVPGVEPQLLIGQCISLVSSRYKRLPSAPRARDRWISSHWNVAMRVCVRQGTSIRHGKNN